MSLLRRLRRLIERTSPRARRERRESRAAGEVRDELDFHVEMRTRELIDAGVPASTARKRAKEAFGSVAPIDAECRRLTSLQYRRARRGRMLEGIVRDLLTSSRSLSRQPLLTVAAVVILAFGFAATTVVYGLVDTLLLRPLPVREPQRLVALFNHSEGQGYFSSVSYLDFVDYRNEVTALSTLLAYSDSEVTLAGDDDRPVTARADAVTANYFTALGLAARQGRLFRPSQADERDNFEAAVIISHALWRQRYGASVEAIGRTITVNGIPATLVGVAPPGFRGVEKDTLTDLWIPLGLRLQMEPTFAEILKNQRGAHWLTVVGYLSDGASLDDARAEMTVLSQQHAEAYPDSNEDFRMRVAAAGRGVIWPDRRAGVTTLSGTLSAGVALVLLIACANVGNLLLVRAAGRRREFGVRLALGASRGQLARLLLTESALLAFASAAAGLLLAAWARGLLARTVVPADLAHLLDGGIDGGAVTLAVALALFAGLAFGLAPALRASDPDIVGAIKSDLGHGGIRRRRLTLGNGLVVAQIALSLPLLVSATLISRSLWNQMTIDLGIDTHDLLLVDINPGSGGYEPDQGQEIYDRLLERVSAMPSVTEAAYTRVAPLGRIRLAGEVGTAGMADDEARKSVEMNIVSPGYAAASSATLLRGREFTRADSAAGSPAVMVNQTMAELFWPGGEPLGQFIEMNWLSGPIRAAVVGIIVDHRYGRVNNEQVSLAGEKPRLYLPLAQEYQPIMTLLVRSSADTRALAEPVLQIARELAPAIPDTRVESFRQHVAGLLPQQRLVAGLLIVAGFIGVMLAAVGIYAVMAYSVSRRMREMGIRLTLGAQRSDVLRQVIGESLTLCIVGIGAGLLGALGTARWLASMLYGVSSIDPASYLGVAATLLIVAVLATWLPGRAAADSDPLVALRRQ